MSGESLPEDIEAARRCEQDPARRVGETPERGLRTGRIPAELSAGEETRHAPSEGPRAQDLGRTATREEYLEAFFEGAITPIVFLDRQFNYIRVNEAFARACGRNIAEFAGRNHFDLYPSDAKAVFEQVVATKVPFQAVASPILFPDHPERGIAYWDWSLAPVLDKSGEVEFLVYSVFDVTSRTEAENHLRRTNELLERIFSTPYVKVAYMDTQFKYLRVNPAFAELLGRTPAQLVGRCHFDLHADEPTHAIFRRVVETGQPYSAHAEPLPFGRQVKGEPTYWNWTARPVHDAFGNLEGILLRLVDVTEQKQAEDRQASLQAQLVQAQKLDMIGRIAAGLAHDFSNLLTGISGYVNLANDVARHARGITESLLTFAGHGAPEKAPLNLCVLVQKTVELLRHTLPPVIRLEMKLCESPVWVDGNAIQLEQVLMNLAGNARDAMSAGGKLEIRLSVATASELAKVGGARRPGATWASLVVQDTGRGMTADVLRHIFEPFFTTKPRGEGKGLGLPLVDAVVKDHGGSINVESQPGAGTTFRVFLPAVPPQVVLPPVEREIPVSGNVARKDGAVILLAEHDRHVRGVVAMALQPLGCEVIQVSNGPALLDALREERRAVRLIISDEDLPERSGLECLRDLRARGMKTPVILMTCRGDAELRTECGCEATVVHKPFDLPDLERLVRSALGV